MVQRVIYCDLFLKRRDDANDEVSAMDDQVLVVKCNHPVLPDN